jgi:two-component system cell cycle response regulator DivK
VSVATIVIVEDQPDNLKLLTTLLTLKGHQVVGLPNGDRLADLVRTHTPPPDLVLLDIQLPGRDGYALLEELKTLPQRSWRVVALTAHALEEDRARAAAAGFDGYITKPIDVRTFPAEVARYLQPR